MNKWLYRFDFEGQKECEYLWLWSDAEAIAYGKEHSDLIQIVEVDANKECFPDKRVVWY